MEESFQINTEDNFKIFGTLNYKNELSSRGVVFVHGLTGNQHEHIFFNAPAYFCGKGCVTVRFNLYGFQPQARRLDRTTVGIHALDLHRVLEYLRRRGVKELHLVGHSLGGMVTLLCDTSKIASVVLWDPTYSPDKLVETNARIDRRINSYVIDWGVKHLWGKRMVSELLELPDGGDLIGECDAPVKIIAAGSGELVEEAQNYFDEAPDPKALAVIEGATHCFDEEGTERKLYSETYKWIKKYSEAP